MISTRDNNDEKIENMSFQNVKEMAKELETLARTNDESICYVDIYMPVLLLQVGTELKCILIIVNTYLTQCAFYYYDTKLFYIIIDIKIADKKF